LNISYFENKFIILIYFSVIGTVLFLSGLLLLLYAEGIVIILLQW